MTVAQKGGRAAMTKTWMIAVLLSAGLGACQAKKPESAAPAEEVSGGTPAAQPATPEIGWLDADGPGESAIEWPSSEEGKPGFMISCSQESAVFRISLPDPAPSSAPTGNEAPAILSFDAAEFPITVLTSEIVGPHLDGEIPVTAKLLEAIARAARVRVATPAGSFETPADSQRKLAGFVAECAALTGISPAP